MFLNKYAAEPCEGRSVAKMFESITFSLNLNCGKNLHCLPILQNFIFLQQLLLLQVKAV